MAALASTHIFTHTHLSLVAHRVRYGDCASCASWIASLLTRCLAPLGSAHSLSFCAVVLAVRHSQLYKMEPETFAAWGNVLRRLPSGFLWLTRVSVRKDTSLYAQDNLHREIAHLGVRTERVGFSFRFPQDDFVSLRALADLMVDNRAYNAHTTGADTFWSGVPAVATASRHLAGRASASFASAVGVANMVVPSFKSYEDVVFELGTFPRRLWTMRRRLLQMREDAPFFDLPRLARGQHRLARAMWGVHAAGRQPMHVVAAR